MYVSSSMEPLRKLDGICIKRALPQEQIIDLFDTLNVQTWKLSWEGNPYQRKTNTGSKSLNKYTKYTTRNSLASKSCNCLNVYSTCVWLLDCKLLKCQATTIPKEWHGWWWWWWWVVVVVVVSGPLGRCGQPNILPHAISEQPPQASLAVLQHRFWSWGLATPNAAPWFHQGPHRRTSPQARRPWIFKNSTTKKGQ